MRHGDDATTRAVREAVHVAATWLEGDRCQQLFRDFRDSKGRLLAEDLLATRQTAREYLRWLIFWNGAHERGCIWGDAFATTRPGSRVVYLCPVFKNLLGNPDHAAAILIHEELHSLGLGENPPSSIEITSAVVARCAPADSLTRAR